MLRDALTPGLADAVFGLGVEAGATRYLERLFARAGTLWSYDLVTLAEADGQVAGMVSHAPWSELAQRYRATMWAYVRVYGPVRVFKLLPRLRALIRASPRVPPDHWFIPYLAVTAKHRRNGVAHALLDSVYQRAESRASACSLYVLAENLPARRFYEHAGYQERACESSTPLYDLARHSRSCEAGAGSLGRSDLAAESDKPTPPGYGRAVRSQSRYHFFDSSEYTWLGSR